MTVFLDSSIIFYKKQDTAKYKEFEDLIKSDNILIINSLVRLEVLQGINYKDANLHKKFIKLFGDRFEIKEINRDIYEMAIRIDRVLKSKGITLKKGKTKDVAGVIDIINFCTSKYYQCEMAHNDKDFDKLDKCYQDFKASHG